MVHRLRDPEEEFLQEEGVEVPGEAPVPTDQGDRLEANQEEVSSRRGAEVSSRPGAEVSMRQGEEVSSRQGKEVSRHLGEVAASRRDEPPSLAVVVLLGPILLAVAPNLRAVEALSVPIHQVVVAPIHQAAGDPNLRGALAPILRAAEGPSHLAVEDPSLPVAEAPIPVAPCRMEVRYQTAVPWGVCSSSVPCPPRHRATVTAATCRELAG